ncbi:MAG: hypothetical protein GY822_32160 [Deltaproteobacteria bacterium]|nr:hypothetical protein [Deltaproteobacteria bacterium]
MTLRTDIVGCQLAGDPANAAGGALTAGPADPAADEAAPADDSAPVRG